LGRQLATTHIFIHHASFFFHFQPPHFRTISEHTVSYHGSIYLLSLRKCHGIIGSAYVCTRTYRCARCRPSQSQAASARRAYVCRGAGGKRAAACQQCQHLQMYTRASRRPLQKRALVRRICDRCARATRRTAWAQLDHQCWASPAGSRPAAAAFCMLIYTGVSL
jgi:hypothetical protein